MSVLTDVRTEDGNVQTVQLPTPGGGSPTNATRKSLSGAIPGAATITFDSPVYVPLTTGTLTVSNPFTLIWTL